NPCWIPAGAVASRATRSQAMSSRLLAVLLLTGPLVAQGWGGAARMPNNLPIPNPGGFATTVSTAGYVDLRNEFFQDLGTNGRRCVTCHLPTAGWSVTPAQVQ